MSEAADAAMIEAADADGRLRDDPLTDRPVDAAAAAERERSAKAAKLAAQTANAMVAVQGQLKLRGKAADKAGRPLWGLEPWQTDVYGGLKFAGGGRLWAVAPAK